MLGAVFAFDGVVHGLRVGNVAGVRDNGEAEGDHDGCEPQEGQEGGAGAEDGGFGEDTGDEDPGVGAEAG